MLTELQKTLLAAAAKREAYTQGSIAHIMMVALQMQDIDTIKYIAENYCTDQHFDKQDQLFIKDSINQLELAMCEPVGSA